MKTLLFLTLADARLGAGTPVPVYSEPRELLWFNPPNQCVCNHGVAARGADCPLDGARKCVRCAPGYSLDPVGYTCSVTPTCGDRATRAANQQLCRQEGQADRGSSNSYRIFVPRNLCLGPHGCTADDCCVDAGSCGAAVANASALECSRGRAFLDSAASCAAEDGGSCVFTPTGNASHYSSSSSEDLLLPGSYLTSLGRVVEEEHCCLKHCGDPCASGDGPVTCGAHEVLHFARPCVGCTSAECCVANTTTLVAPNSTNDTTNSTGQQEVEEGEEECAGSYFSKRFVMRLTFAVTPPAALVDGGALLADADLQNIFSDAGQSFFADLHGDNDGATAVLRAGAVAMGFAGDLGEKRFCVDEDFTKTELPTPATETANCTIASTTTTTTTTTTTPPPPPITHTTTTTSVTCTTSTTLTPTFWSDAEDSEQGWAADGVACSSEASEFPGCAQQLALGVREGLAATSISYSGPNFGQKCPWLRVDLGQDREVYKVTLKLPRQKINAVTPPRGPSGRMFWTSLAAVTDGQSQESQEVQP